MKKDNRKPAFDIKAINNQLAQIEFNELNDINQNNITINKIGIDKSYMDFIKVLRDPKFLESKEQLLHDMMLFGTAGYKVTTEGVTVLSQEEIQKLKGDEKRN